MKKPKNKDDVTYWLLVALSVAALIVAFVGHAVSDVDEPEGVQLPETRAVDTDRELDTIPADTVFIPVTAAETEAETEPVAAPDTSEQAPTTDDQPYSDDLLYLAKIIQNEAGSDFCSDEHQRAVASVVLNRVSDPRFPDTILGVITQGWNGECALQYAVGGWECFNALEPSERAMENARYVLENGSTVEGAIWQAEFIQGEIVAEFAYPEIYSTVTYICR